jgi:hypothetical protein
MTAGALKAFRNVDFHWVRSLESIWSETAESASGPNDVHLGALVSDLQREAVEANSHPLGRVLTGRAGIGKTHLMSQLRASAWKSGGWFVLLDVLGLNDFWRCAALSFVTSLLQEMPNGRRQFEAVLAGVARRFKVEEQVELAFASPTVDPKQLVDILLKGLSKTNLNAALSYGDVFRALCLLRSTDLAKASLAHAWLQGYDADPTLRQELGFVTPPPAPNQIVKGISWIMSLSGPTFVGLDQIDGIIAPTALGSDNHEIFGLAHNLPEILASGLLELSVAQTRSMIVITCLESSWALLEERGMMPFLQRFQPSPIALQGMDQAIQVRELIVQRLSPAYRQAKLQPPYASWPFSDAAIAGVAQSQSSPRAILMACDAFRRECIEKGAVRECDRLVDDPPCPPKPRTGLFDLEAEKRKTDISGVLAGTDESMIGRLLFDAFDLYADQLPAEKDLDILCKSDPAKASPPLHGRLTFIHHDENDREQHFCFRAIPQTHAVSFQARLRAALTASGICAKMADRHLILVRRGANPSGPKTRELVNDFVRAGGKFIDPSDEDLRTFSALRAMRLEAESDGRADAFSAWMQNEQPLLATEFFRAAGLSPPPLRSRRAAPGPAKPTDAAGQEKPEKIDRKPSAVEDAPRTAPPVAPRAVEEIPVGRRMSGGELVTLRRNLLSRHTAIIAGSGSGKTVLLRRIVEEAALSGVPAIVIDPNNDLSQLGQPWPTRPEAFNEDDDAKAARYRASVEVVVWTPGVHAGNPIFLSVLPDFAAIGPDKDSRQQAIEMACETLAPIAGAKTDIKRGVLADALRRFAKNDGGALADFISLLADLPDGASEIDDAAKQAGQMANSLRAAVATNPLLRAEGPILDPSVLYYAADPAKVRISVINLAGLASAQAREDFVNRMQMALFVWIKSHPSPTGLLYVVDEAQTFMPSGASTISLGSSIRLIAQGRKYGLGMIVATQAPKGINNQIVSNCTTQFFGRQSAPATISAAQEIMGAKGGGGEDIGRLKAGEFYYASEDTPRPIKVKTSLCLSAHPSNPPAPQTILEIAARSRPR